jgi:hypothetical protein
LSLAALSGCVAVGATQAETCETSLAKIAAAPAQHIGRAFCGEAVLAAGHLLALAVPPERPAMSPDELAVIVIGASEYAKYGLSKDKNYRVRIEGETDGDARCFVKSNDVCTPYERQLFLYPKRMEVLGPA